ncbi:MAG: TROVE domain-containing protein [Chloroflexota bacterium]
MTKNLTNWVKNLTQTPQNQPIPGTTQVANSGGGYAWEVDDWTRLDRFLVLGSEGGTYYIKEQALTQQNAQAVIRCIDADGLRTVARIVEISEAGRAPKNDPAIFALALATTLGNTATKRAAFDAITRVCRTGTHIFHFAQYVDGMRGWGRGLREAVGKWYAMPSGKLALQAIKYQQRDGWAHRDLLRLAHPKPITPVHEILYGWMVKGWESVGEMPHPDASLVTIWAFERAKLAKTPAEIISLVQRYNLPREAIPTEWLNTPEVWEALLAEMPLEAMTRNLAKMTTVGLLAPNSTAVRKVVSELGNPERIRKARLHPIKVLAALKTYAQGHGERGKLKWTPVPRIIDALNDAFYTAFGNVVPTNKRWLLALDVSGSMDGSMIAGVSGLDARMGSAAMALVTAATEPDHTMVGFSSASGGYGGQWGGGESGLTPVNISPRMRLDDVVNTMRAIPMGGTDCALPMKWALKNEVPADVFVVYTDSETWAGTPHPAQALRDYRDKMGIPAKMIVVGMTSNGFSIADPDDVGMLDVVGFDTAVPQIMSDFVAG